MTFSEEPYGELVDSTARVMTWNVWGRFGPWERRAPAIARVLRETAADIVLLQECWFAADGADQAAELGLQLGMDHCSSGGDPLFDGWGLGNAVLSRWPIVDHQVVELPTLEPTGWGGLALHAAVVDGPRGRILTYSLALDWPPQASRARRHALRHLAVVIDADAKALKAPVVVGGDLNAAPDSDEVRMLVGLTEPACPGFVLFDAWDAASPGSLDATWSRANPWTRPLLLPSRRIDYVFTGWPRRGGVGSAVFAALAGTEQIDGVMASDHYAVYADIRY